MIGVIFDVDGVIIDVKESYHYCIKETAEYFLGKELSIEDVRALKFQSGINNDYLATLYVIEHFGGKAKLEDVIVVFDEKYKKLRDKEKLILSRELFESLKDKGLKLGILTGRPRGDLEYAFNRFGLYPYFDCIVDDDTIENEDLRKPNPYALNFCLERMKVSKSVYIGDSLADYNMWIGFREKYRKEVIYIHFGKHVRVDGAVHAEDENGLRLALEEVLRSLR